MNAKTTTTELPKATHEQKQAAPSTATATLQAVAPASPSAAGPIKTASTPISSTETEDTTATEGKSVASASPAVKAEKKPKAPTKMEIASSIYPITVMCPAFDVSRSGYYAWASGVLSPRAQEDERLKVAIKAVHKQSRETYGPLRMQPELVEQGFEAGRNRIARLRRELGLRCKQKRKFKATTNSNHDLPVADNLLNQTFAPTRPNEAWVTDITYIQTGEGWLYLAGVKDVFTCEIVGYAMGERMTQALTAQALWRAATNKRPAPGLIHHSDRGSQYCAHDYRKLVEQFGMKASMSRKGNCYDNAPMESFWGSLKNELVHHQRYATRADAQSAIQEYIESFYNRQRRHSRLGNVPPALFAESFSKQPQAA